MFCYVSCNLCGNDNTTPLEQGNSPYRVVKCKDCGLIYLNPQPLIQSLQEQQVREACMSNCSLELMSCLESSVCLDPEGQKIPCESDCDTKKSECESNCPG